MIFTENERRVISDIKKKMSNFINKRKRNQQIIEEIESAKSSINHIHFSCLTDNQNELLKEYLQNKTISKNRRFKETEKELMANIRNKLISLNFKQNEEINIRNEIENTKSFLTQIHFSFIPPDQNKFLFQYLRNRLFSKKKISHKPENRLMYEIKMKIRCFTRKYLIYQKYSEEIETLTLLFNKSKK